MRRGTRLALLAVGAAVVVLVQAVPGSFAGYSAVITNSTDSTGVNPYYTCAAAVTTDRASAVYAYALDEGTSTTSATDNSPNAANGTYVGTRTVDTATTPKQACARDTTVSADVFNGSSNMVSTPTSMTGPNTFTLEAWIKTTSTAGGRVIDFGNQKTSASSTYDRILYVNTNGKAVFGVYNGGAIVLTSTTTVNDGQWHHLMATFNSTTGTATTGTALYVDGRPQGASATSVVAQSNTGYWRIGYDTTGSWPNAGSVGWFNGEMKYVAIYSTAFTAAQAGQHWGGGQVTP